MKSKMFVRKGRYAGWQARNCFPLWGDRRLILTSARQGSAKAVTCVARVVKIEGDFEVSVMYQDFVRRLVSVPCSRVTEGAVIAAQLKGEAMVPALVEEIKAFYKAKGENVDA